MLVARYLASLYETVLSHAERDALTKIAYHDPLTGLYNRAKANERFEELDAQDTAVALINFDVNGLKYVNDNFGHEEGDNLLKGISEAIEKAFGNIGTGFRMGGDEFLCIVDPAGIFTIKQAADNMEQELKEKSRNSRFTYSVSYGIAYRNKGEKRSIQELFTEADEKMYAMKEKSKYSRKALEGKA
jgi:diguanylate cyclase (GGDEF)-like protein